MKSSSHLGFWLLVVILGFLAAPMLRSGDDMQAFVDNEVNQTRQALGPTVGAFVLHFADSVFDESPLGEIARMARNTKHSRADAELSMQVAGPGGEVMSKLFNGYLQGIVWQTYVVAMRLAIVCVWLLVLSPLLIAAIHDGFMNRRIKRAEFGVIRPATFSIASFFVIPLLMLPLIYLVIPFSLSPMLAPGWALILAMPLSLLVSNMQPIFGR
jgi:hypothetical protein